MNANVLQTKRRWSWGVFLVLVGLNIVGVAAVQLYRIFQPNGAAWPGLPAFGIMVLSNSALLVVYCGIGLFLAYRIGLGLPILEGWFKRKPVPVGFRTVVAIAWITGVVFGLSLLFLSELVFGPPMRAMFQELGITYPEPAKMSPLIGILASLYGGISEETIVRLLGLTVIAWLGSLLFHDADGRPKLAVLWVANILLALYFGIGHLQSAARLGWPMNPLIITRGLLLNGIAGLVFGWLYWKYGLESAILAHFFADIIVQTVNPLIAMWQGQPAGTALVAGVAVFILLSLIWAGRSLVAANRKGLPGGALAQG